MKLEYYYEIQFKIYLYYCRFLCYFVAILFLLMYNNYRKMKGGFMMISSDFRLDARKKLEGKWGKVVCMTFVYMLTFFIISFIGNHLPDSMSAILSIIIAIIELPLGFGLIIALFKVFNDEEVGTFDFFSLGFNNFKRSWAISFRVFLKMIVPFILLIVSYVLITFGMVGMVVTSFYSSPSASSLGFLSIIGFILLIISIIWAVTKSYYYQLSYLVAIDNSELTSKEAVEKSAKLMEGKRWKFFCLQFSFIGWAILATFTFGIGYLWLIPYIQFAIISFYKFVNGDNSNVEAEIVTENDDNPIQGE